MPQIRSVPALLAALVLVLLTGSARAELWDDIEAILRRNELKGARIAISVRDPDESGTGFGREVYAHNADLALIPASNQKLLTTGAALLELGGAFRFETGLRLVGDDLVIHADGDPSFGDPNVLAQFTLTPDTNAPLDPESFVDIWARAILDAGIHDVDTIIVDDRVFDREYVHPDWPQDQLNRRYCAEVSGLSFHLNQLWVYPTPRPGAPATFGAYVPRYPTNLLRRSEATSRQGPHDRNTAWIARKLGTNELTLYGNVKHPNRMVPVTVHNVPLLFGELLKSRIRAVHAEREKAHREAVALGNAESRPPIDLNLGRVRLAGPDDLLGAGTQPIAPTSTALTAVITRCNQDSQNLYAEALLKRIGHARTGQPGSWLNGAATLRQIMQERFGAGAARLTTGLIVHDGSGLSKANRVAPSTMTAWLASFHKDPALGRVFMQSLAVGGQTGTLTNRLTGPGFHGARVHAKTGFVNGVSCLSGYVTAPGGERRCFSIMINELATPVRVAKGVQDKIVAAIARDIVPAAVTTGAEPE